MPGERKDANASACKSSHALRTVRGRRNIDNLFRTGSRLSGRNATLIFREHPAGETRLSVFVPRRLGGSVLRNRARRVLREYARTNHYPALSGKEIIILCTQPVAGESLDKTKSEIGRLLESFAGE